MHDTLHELTFEGKKDEENLLVFVRQHWFLLVPPVIFAAGASILPLVLIVVFASVIVAHPGSSSIFMLGWLVYLMCIWFALAYKIVFYILNVWIVTNSRILDIWQKGLFNREISELHLESIQDISVNTKGIVQSYLNFGNIDIQTAATEKHFTFEEVPHPLHIKDAVMDAANVFVQKHDKDQRHI